MLKRIFMIIDMDTDHQLLQYIYIYTFEVTRKREKDETKTDGLSCNCFSGLPTLFSQFSRRRTTALHACFRSFYPQVGKESRLVLYITSPFPLLYASRSRFFVMASKSYHWSNLGIIFRVLFCFSYDRLIFFFLRTICHGF